MQHDIYHFVPLTAEHPSEWQSGVSGKKSMKCNLEFRSLTSWHWNEQLCAEIFVILCRKSFLEKSFDDFAI